MREIPDIVYDESIGEWGKLDLYLPETDSFPLLVYFHGGSLEKGSRRAAHIGKTLTEMGIGLASAEYRLYPEAKYPDFILDAARAVNFCREHIGEYCRECRGIFVGGSSAGGYLSMMLCFDPKYLGQYGIAPTDIAGFIHNAGQPTCHFNVLRERGLDKRRVIIDDSAPLYHVGLADEYPPMLLMWSENDMVNRPEQMEVLWTALHHFGYDGDKIRRKVLPGKHCGYVKATDENGNNVFASEISDFILEYSK